MQLLFHRVLKFIYKAFILNDLLWYFLYIIDKIECILFKMKKVDLNYFHSSNGL